MPVIDRAAIYERDGGICGLCGKPVAFEDLDIDHVVHRWRGGHNGALRTTGDELMVDRGKPRYV